MKYPLLGLFSLVAAVSLQTQAKAQNYPWCAHLNFGDDAVNCGFETEQQCRQTVSGIGGFCARNTTYQPTEGPRRHRE